MQSFRVLKLELARLCHFGQKCKGKINGRQHHEQEDDCAEHGYQTRYHYRIGKKSVVIEIGCEHMHGRTASKLEHLIYSAMEKSRHNG